MVTSMGEDHGARRCTAESFHGLAVSYLELDAVHMGLYLILILCLTHLSCACVFTLPKEKVGNYFDLKELPTPGLFFPHILL